TFGPYTPQEFFEQGTCQFIRQFRIGGNAVFIICRIHIGYVIADRNGPGTDLPERKLQRLNDLSSSVLPIRYGGDGHRFAVPFLVHKVDHIFETGRITSVVLWCDYDDAFSLVDPVTEGNPLWFGVFHTA